jgi:hypothetical protein
MRPRADRRKPASIEYTQTIARSCTLGRTPSASHSRPAVKSLSSANCDIKATV